MTSILIKTLHDYITTKLVNFIPSQLSVLVFRVWRLTDCLVPTFQLHRKGLQSDIGGRRNVNWCLLLILHIPTSLSESSRFSSPSFDSREMNTLPPSASFSLKRLAPSVLPALAAKWYGVRSIIKLFSVNVTVPVKWRDRKDLWSFGYYLWNFWHLYPHWLFLCQATPEENLLNVFPSRPGGPVCCRWSLLNWDQRRTLATN